MKITKIEPIILYAQDTGSFQSELNVGGYAGFQVVVHVETDEGFDGWGECCTGGEYGESALAVKTLIERGFVPRIKDENPGILEKSGRNFTLTLRGSADGASQSSLSAGSTLRL